MKFKKFLISSIFGAILIGVTGYTSAEAGFFLVFNKVYSAYLNIETIRQSYIRAKKRLESYGEVKSAPSTNWSYDILEKIIQDYHRKLRSWNEHSSYAERDYKIIPQTQGSIFTDDKIISKNVRQNLQNLIDSLEAKENHSDTNYWNERCTRIAKILEYCLCIALYEQLNESISKRDFFPKTGALFLPNDGDRYAMRKIQVANGKHLFSVGTGEIYDHLSVLTNDHLLRLQDQLRDCAILKIIKTELSVCEKWDKIVENKKHAILNRDLKPKNNNKYVGKWKREKRCFSGLKNKQRHSEENFETCNLFI